MVYQGSAGQGLTSKFDFNAEIQNFFEYFYPLSFNFNADFQKVNAEILFTLSYLELWFDIKF